MASIVFTGITSRIVGNWAPVLRELQRRGHDVRSLLLPHTIDPDSAGLVDAVADIPSVGVVPLEDSLWTATGDTWRAAVSRAADLLRGVDPEVVLLTACHAGPEAALPAAFATDDLRPVFIGCQHGFIQNWDGYWNTFGFDHLLVFGSMFRALAPAALADRVHVAGLAKLDAIERRPRPPFAEDARPILFAGQRTCTDALVAMLRALRDTSSREVLVRPHPEHRDAFRAAELPLLDHRESLPAQLDRCSLLVTTGSTSALEALAAGTPVVVLPVERGEMYGDAGIVVTRLDAAEVLSVARGQAAAGPQATLRSFLVAATGGDRPGRVATGADVIERLCGSRCT